MQFEDYYKRYNFSEIIDTIKNKTSTTKNSKKAKLLNVPDIIEYQNNGNSLSLDHLFSLLSPEADRFLDIIIKQARSITLQRFGRVIQLYAPLYLSNHCHSTCTYCGFSRPNLIRRLTLKISEAINEADILYNRGIRHILLLSGEDYKAISIEYLEEIIKCLSKKFASISIEVYPLNIENYSRLKSVGLDGVAVYQETYDPQRYKQVHLGGVKKRMLYRLNCPDRIGEANIRNISIGALLGLSDAPADVFFVALHTSYLIHKYWQTNISVSLPRLKSAIGINKPPLIKDRDYIRYLCALRILFPDIGLILSTRENKDLRNYLSEICITQISADSKTEPGGYSGKESDEQFETSDQRSTEELKKSLITRGIEPIFVDWNPG